MVVGVQNLFTVNCAALLEHEPAGIRWRVPETFLVAGADSATDRVQEQAPTVGAWAGSTDPTPC